MDRFVCSSVTGEEKIFHYTTEQAKQTSAFKDPQGQDYEIKETMPFVEYLAENYKKFGTALQFVTDRSQEGSQFVKGFGGIGGLLRYTIDFTALDDDQYEEEYDFFY